MIRRTLVGFYSNMCSFEEPKLSEQPKRRANACNRVNIPELKVSEDMVYDF
jgi:hypothetical protein